MKLPDFTFKHCNVLPSLMSSPLKSASTTYFDVYCDHILDAIHKHRWSGKQKYFDTFTVKKWEKMSVADGKKHTVSKCYACSTVVKKRPKAGKLQASRVHFCTHTSTHTSDFVQVVIS